MRNAEQITQAIKEIFSKYDEAYPDAGGFADKDIAQLILHTKSRRRAEFLTSRVDALNLTDAEIEAFEKHIDQENDKKAEELFHEMIATKQVPKAEYILNNMRRKWSLEKRQELVKCIGESYDICPITGNVDTKHSIKKKLKEQARLQAEVGNKE